MICKLCNKDVPEKFCRHLNGAHRMKKGEYLKMFPEQVVEYENQVVRWNKGLTAADHPSVAKIAVAIKEFQSRPESRQRLSEQLKRRYQEQGDILDSETRARVAKAGSDGWVKKITSCSKEEQSLLLNNFWSASNEFKKNLKDIWATRTPEDHTRLCGMGLGEARYYNCDFCGKELIRWFGGDTAKVRSKKRFCNQACWNSYQDQHPFYVLNNITRFYSPKMQSEFCLRSKLEVWFAELLESNQGISSWCVPPFHIKYEYLGKMRKYYPDFLINDKHMVELKSGYVLKIQGMDRTAEKLKTAQRFCEEKQYDFHYWQFDEDNMTAKKFGDDCRVVEFFKVVSL